MRNTGVKSHLHCLRDLFPEYPEQQRQDDADNDAGGDGEVEGEILFSNNDVSGESPDPGNLLANQQKKPYHDNQNA